MIKLTTLAITLTAIGIFTSVSILGISQALFAVSVIHYFFKAYKDKNLELPKSTYWLLAFIAISCISLLINLEFVPKPTKNFGRLKYLLFGALGIYVFKYWLKETSTKIQRVVVTLFISSVILAAAYGSIKFFVTGEERLRGFTDTLRYGYGMGMTLLVILSAYLHRKKLEKWVNPHLFLLAFVIGFVGLYFSYTRGAFLGFFCGLPFVCYFYSKKLGITLGSLAVLVVLTLGGFYLFGHGNYGSRFLISKNNNSDNTRRSQWKAAIIATQEKPLLGWGFSNFHSQLKRIKYDYDLDAKHYNDAHAHNLFLETSSGTGIVGLLVFIGFVFTWALECFMAAGLTRALVVPFGVAWVISSQFEMTFDANNASLIFLLYPLSCVLGVLSKNAKDIHSHT